MGLEDSCDHKLWNLQAVYRLIENTRLEVGLGGLVHVGDQGAEDAQQALYEKL